MRGFLGLRNSTRQITVITHADFNFGDQLDSSLSTIRPPSFDALGVMPPSC